MSYALEFSYYNGNGTHGGGQALHFEFLDSLGNPLPVRWSYATSRGGCIYGRWGRDGPGGLVPATSNVFDLVASIRMSASNVSGNQGPC